MNMKMPKDKFMSSVKVGEKGQIVIPKEVREMFGIEPGDMLLLLADKAQGIAIVENDGFLQFASDVLRRGKPMEEKGDVPDECH